MSDLNKIKERYQQMGDQELIRLSKHPADLRPDVIPLLEAELLKRGKVEEAMELTRFPEEPAGINYKDLSLEEIRQLVAERLALGEAMDSIKIDLRLQGVDVFEVLKEDNLQRDVLFDSIVQLKEKGASSEEIDTHLEQSYQVDRDEAEQLKIELKSKGKRNKTLGTILMIFGFLLALIILSCNSIRGLLHCGIIIFGGMSLFFLGAKQSKE